VLGKPKKKKQKKISTKHRIKKKTTILLTKQIKKKTYKFLHSGYPVNDVRPRRHRPNSSQFCIGQRDRCNNGQQQQTMQHLKLIKLIKTLKLFTWFDVAAGFQLVRHGKTWAVLKRHWLTFSLGKGGEGLGVG